MVELVYFTDPYCSWCWATEPIFYRIRVSFGEQVRFRYVMGGLVRDMAEFYDPVNDIGSLEQVAPHWRMVSDRSGQPIDEGLFSQIRDPHFSTWPACIAVKAAFLQGEEVGERFLRRMRRAALTERKVISDPGVYVDLALEVEGLDLRRFQQALEGGEAETAFLADLEECRRYGVTGFPTVLLRRLSPISVAGSGRPLLIVGHRSFETYREALARLGPELEERPPGEVEHLLSRYGPLTTRELSEVYGKPAEEVRAAMESLASAGRVKRIPVNRGEFWSLA